MQAATEKLQPVAGKGAASDDGDAGPLPAKLELTVFFLLQSTNAVFVTMTGGATVGCNRSLQKLRQAFCFTVMAMDTR